ncbi:UPF0481 protein At3g47200 isoform X3 [Populus trichocarpa]|jgi:hypothetical protein|nr:UPF0481 protein At3g47200 isoform X3 [Populus trichocarpa]XP_024448488.1 UPF0481 protein At3g47200 isoform X3 [Populus trichocarpa]XP_052307751.1 UPF0481 protein At3g47200 isoform X3 [Populus trichocarpa]|eukprot:XP_024448487.1 UPF0481 protein At3g47200 isoform X4 [Populus trichocarpa]
MENGGTSSTNQQMIDQSHGNVGEEENSQLPLDINKLAKSLRADMEMLHSFSDQCCIYRVPIRLRESNEKIFTPQVVNLGPLHHGKEELKAMEEHKILYLQDFLKWSTASMEDVIKVVEERETRLRNCYAETIDLGREDFVKMILLDASFIIMVLLKDCCEGFESSNDRIFNKPWMLSDISLDMCLIENQLPFFILEDLFKASNITKCSPAEEEYSVIELAHKFFEKRWDSWLKKAILEEINSSEVAHFVDFIRKCQKPSESDKTDKELETINVPSITELDEAGVKFSSFEQGKSLLDMKFDRGILEMPLLKIDDNTEILFRNIQAFEQCHCDEYYIANYISMINFLVITPKDVEILVRNGIIENWIHDYEAVTTLLHNISKENALSADDFIFASLVEDLNAYCRRRWNKWKATLKQEYFHTPWAIISLIAALVLLILTMVQTVCSLIQL